MESKFYAKNGYFGRSDFETLAERMGLMPKRAHGIINAMLSNQNEVAAMVEHSFLSKEAKEKFLNYYKDKVRRFS
jgi:hypothetical protein